MVELLVVIAVIAIIVAVAVPNISGILGNAAIGAAKQNANMVASTASAANAIGVTNLGTTPLTVATALAGGVSFTNGTQVFGPISCSMPPTNAVVNPLEDWQHYLNVDANGIVSLTNQ